MTILISAPAQQRGPGVIITPSIDIASDAVGVMRIIAIIATNDYIDTANSFWLRIYQMDPAIQVWREMAGIKWNGGAVDDPELGINPMPYSAFEVTPYRGRSLRAELDIPIRMRVGAQVELTPNWPTGPPE
jgi:hypothetical protein